MRLVLQLSNEDLALAEAEATALYPNSKRIGNVVVAEGNPNHLPRLVLTRFAGKLIAELDTLENLNLPPYKSFAVRVSRLGEVEKSSEIINKIAKSLTIILFLEIEIE